MLNKIRKLREKKGFTLVELIVVIAIIAILTAVLVPLIGNWTQQAAYTTLQDGAQTISNSVNNAMAKVTMGGAPASIYMIDVTKASGALTIKIDNNAVTVPETPSNSDSTVVKIATEVKTILEATLPNGSAFLASITNGAVDGVIYRNDAATSIANGTVKAITQFNEAYQYAIGGNDVAVGVSGKFKGDFKVGIDNTNKKVTATAVSSS